MTNIHGRAVKRLLIARGVGVHGEGREWRIDTGTSRYVIYIPSTGICKWRDPMTGVSKRESLRGSPERVAEILQGLVR